MRSDDSLLLRVHVTPDAVTHSSREVRARFETGVQALKATLAMLEPLPKALVSRWLRTDDGHVIINASQHAFTWEKTDFRGRSWYGVAWVRLSWLLQDPIRYLTPIGILIAHKIGWEQTPQPQNQPWRDFVQGVLAGFKAGYGRSPSSQHHPIHYLAEGIAWHLVDSRQFNIENPQLQKLLRRTVFSEDWYRWLDAP